MAEPAQLARDVVAAPDRGLGATLSSFATGLGDRYLGFGIGRAPAESSLVQRVTERWQPMGGGLHDLSVFGDDALGGVGHQWGSYGGYDWGFESGGPFVIPVDPVEHPTGFAAQHTRRPTRRPSFVAQPRRGASPRPVPAARETWRATAASSDAPLSPYPAAMGRAGAIDPQLLRFPDARAELRPAGGAGRGEGPRALITAPGPSRRWGGAPAGAIAPAAAGAEALAEALVAAADGPAPTEAADAWLVDADLPPAARAAWSARASVRAPRLGARAALPLRAAQRADAARRADAAPSSLGFGFDPVGDLVASPAPAEPSEPGGAEPGGTASPARRSRAVARPAEIPARPAATGRGPARRSARGAAAPRGRRPFIPAAVARLLAQAQPSAAQAPSTPALAPWRTPAEAPGALVAPRAAQAPAGPTQTAARPTRAEDPRPAVTQASTSPASPPQDTPQLMRGNQAERTASPGTSDLAAGPQSAAAGGVGGQPAGAAPEAAGALPSDPLRRALARAADGGAAAPLADLLAWPSAPALPAGPRAAAQAVQALVQRLTAGGGPVVAPAMAARWVRWLTQAADQPAPGGGWSETPGALVAPASTAGAASIAQGPRGEPSRPRRAGSRTAVSTDRAVASGEPALPPAVRAALAQASDQGGQGGAAALGAPSLPAGVFAAPDSPLQHLLGSPEAPDAGLGGLLRGLLGRADALIGRLGQSAWGPAAADPGLAAALAVSDGAPGALVAPRGPEAPPSGPAVAEPGQPPSRAVTAAEAPLVAAVAARTAPAIGRASDPGATLELGTPGAPQAGRRPGVAIGRVGRGARAFGSRRIGAGPTGRSRRGAASRHGLDATLVRPVRDGQPGAARDMVGGSAGVGATGRRAAQRAPVLGGLPAGLARTLAALEGRAFRPDGLAAQAPGGTRPAAWQGSAGLASGWAGREAPGALVLPSALEAGEQGTPASAGAPASQASSAASRARGAAAAPRPTSPGAAGAAATAFATARMALDAKLFGPPPMLAPEVGRPAFAGTMGRDDAPGALVAPGLAAGRPGPSTGGTPGAAEPRPAGRGYRLPATARRALADAAVLAAVGRRPERPRRPAYPGAATGAPGAVVRPGAPGTSRGAAAAGFAAPAAGRRRPMRPANVDRALVAFGRAAQAQAAQQAGSAGRASAGTPPAGVVSGAVGELFSPSAEVGPAIGRPSAARVRPSLHLPGSLFADRGPSVSLGTPGAQPRRVMVDTSRSTAAEALRSTPGQRPQRKAETAEEARHRNADQSEDALSPEEVERIARDVITMLEREAEFDLDRFGEDYD